jgi:prevent-host-death family protein
MYMKPRRYSIARARADLPTLLRAVERGDEIEISRRGMPVAVLLSVADRARLASGRKSFGDAFDAFAAGSAAPQRTPRNTFSRLRSRSPGRKVKL